MIKNQDYTSNSNSRHSQGN